MEMHFAQHNGSGRDHVLDLCAIRRKQSSVEVILCGVLMIHQDCNLTDDIPVQRQVTSIRIQDHVDGR